MPGERSLGALLRGLDPVLHPDELVWCSVPHDAVPEVPAFARIREDEGVTLVLPVEVAEGLGLDHEVPSRRIELRVHSALEAVGLTAAIAGTLAGHGISANVVAAFHHDHVLVPAADAERALALLRDLASAWSAPDAPDRTQVLGPEATVLLSPSSWDRADLDVQLSVGKGAGVTAVVEGWWPIAAAEQLAATLDAIAAGRRDAGLVGGAGEVVLGLEPQEADRWAVEITSAAGDSSGRVVTVLDRAVCAEGAARVRALISGFEGA